MTNPLEQFQLFVTSAGINTQALSEETIGEVGLSLLNNYSLVATNFSLSFCLAIFILFELFFSDKIIKQNITNLYFFFFELTQKQLGQINLTFFFLLQALYFLITLLNVNGMIPYSVTFTAQLIVTFFISTGFMLYINYLSIKLHHAKIFGLFFPEGSPLTLALLIVPIEFISYFFRKISLSVRLFANMMAGHTLLKVIVAFAGTYCQMFNLTIILNTSLTFGVILTLLTALIALETGVAFIQGYVFASLASMYSLDAKNLH